MAIRIGADENGLGARLGPMVVTAVMARTDARGDRLLSRKLPKRLRSDLDDSKRLVSHKNIKLAEAWARCLIGPGAKNPTELFEALSFEGPDVLQERCPRASKPQCWSVVPPEFEADDELVERIAGNVEYLESRGVELRAVFSSVLCAKRLNDERAEGNNRFTSDLHAMERMILKLRAQAGEDVLAVCGKVGGIGQYSNYFGPLSDRLHSVLKQGRAESSYHFPDLGEVRFVRDADATDPLVMLASLVGKYVRELLMGQINDYYRQEVPKAGSCSGYNDPVTARFVRRTAKQRKKLRIIGQCFERDSDPKPRQKVTAGPRQARSPAPAPTGVLPGLQPAPDDR